MRIVTLTVLVFFACLSVIFGVLIIVRSVMFVLPYSTTQFRIVIDILRVLLALGMAYSWLRVWKAITDWYFWRSITSVRGQDAS
jgi:hypothetical protein